MRGLTIGERKETKKLNYIFASCLTERGKVFGNIQVFIRRLRVNIILICPRRIERGFRRLIVRVVFQSRSERGVRVLRGNSKRFVRLARRFECFARRRNGRGKSC